MNRVFDGSRSEDVHGIGPSAVAIESNRNGGIKKKNIYKQIRSYL